MMRSLQSRLLISLTVLIIAAGASAGLVAYKWAFDEAIELQDSLLLQIGAIAGQVRASVQATGIGHLEPEARVTTDEVETAPDKALLQKLPDGLQIVSRGDRQWRLLIRTRPDGSRVSVGQPVEIRERIARASAFQTVLPLAVLIPCLMLVVGLVIRHTLRPVAQLAAQLDSGQADRLETLRLDGTPSELHPFIDSINRLLSRVQTLIDRQRRFIADAAHELRTPVTAISLQAENLDHIALPPDSQQRLLALKAGTRRTRHLLEQLLALARYDMDTASHTSVTCLDRCAKEVVADLMPLALEREIDLGFDGIEPVLVQADTVMMSVMIRNLVDNALRHTPPRGHVDVRLRREHARAILVIEDSGPGVPETELERIFQPFVRGGHAAEGGTGLGLSIVERIVERMGGSIQLQNVASAGRSGLRATVELPAASQ
jgi:two-component system, OmpR family, sensor kinase